MTRCSRSVVLLALTLLPVIGSSHPAEAARLHHDPDRLTIHARYSLLSPSATGSVPGPPP